MNKLSPAKHADEAEMGSTSHHIKTAEQVLSYEALVTSLSISSPYIAVGMDDGRLRVCDSNGSLIQNLKDQASGIWAIDLWQDSLVSGGVDSHVRVWDLVTQKCLHVLSGHTNTVRCLNFLDAKTVLSASADSTLRLWNIESGDCMHVFEGHRDGIRCLAISGDLAVSAGKDAACRIWSLSEKKLLRTLTGHTSTIFALAFDGTKIVTGSMDTTVRVWDTASGICLATLEGHKSLVTNVRLSGNTLVTAGADGLIQVWSLDSMSLRYPALAHENSSVSSLALDGKHIVTSGSNGLVRLWQLQTGQLLEELGGRAKAVWKVGFQDEGSVVVTRMQQADKAVLQIFRLG